MQTYELNLWYDKDIFKDIESLVLYFVVVPVEKHDM